ncbi:error-prone DNA polymerase [Sneathiella aquimaris]|uniref:error-prone DNA polymerase n=1 Tax=Sneathiella aquimaris TaxID=2599305 RepID=UPI00146E3B53|nr:error-prone DNA polymerase [Sneathiella aquimaris]
MTISPDAARYVELAVTSNFSFLRGGSHPHELVLTAATLGHTALAITDRNTLAGIVRAHIAAKDMGIRLIVGVRLVFMNGFECLCFPKNKGAYSRLTRLLTLGNRRANKGECHLFLSDLAHFSKDQVFVVMPPAILTPVFEEQLSEFCTLFPEQASLSLSRLFSGKDQERLEHLSTLSDQYNCPMVATNDILYHIPNRRPLQDVLTCIRNHCTIQQAGFRLQANAERYLKKASEMYRLFSGFEAAVQRSHLIAEKCTFSMDELAYQYPEEPNGESLTPQAELSRLSWIGAKERFPDGIPEKVKQAIKYELTLIDQLKYAPYFLTVHDIVRYARSLTPPILCQGRGSAANSTICYCLGITAVNPAEIDLLFERFISAERDEPPDIDVDFEHERREEVIQYIYAKYGRHRAGLAATVITYRSRSAVREVGKAMGLSDDAVSSLAASVWGRSSSGIQDHQVTESGLAASDPTLNQILKLTQLLIGFPRHLSQHVGGFVITRGPLDELSPISNAAMENRTVVEWDKDDLDALGILKIDVLSLGMLTCLRKSFDLLEQHYHKPMQLAHIPRDDPPTYKMIQKADTVGVFQIESRAQMSMLPRLRPENFYDLVIEIAIVRPGPIQGEMVHPYLRRRQGLEPVEYPSEELKAVLEKTKGVPLFQEQAMKIAMVGAGFTASEADQLRRAMATFKKTGDIGNFRERFINGMINKRYDPHFAELCFKQIEGFSDYGFPESHSASFALLAYASAWLKCHYPDIFAAALLNSQPMGFYSASSIVRDFLSHGGKALPVDINESDWDYTLETPGRGDRYHALRLGFRQISGLKKAAALTITEQRATGYDSVRDLYFRTGIDMKSLEDLAHADAFRSIGLDRREALWAVKGLGGYSGRRAALEELPLFAAAHDAASELQNEVEMQLPTMPLGQHVVEDYASLRLSLKAHPVSFLRPLFDQRRVLKASDLPHCKSGQKIQIAGLVLVRQRPGTAAGVIFMTLEDETGTSNVIIWPKKFEQYRRIVLSSRLLLIRGELQMEQNVIHIIADQINDMSAQLATLTEEGNIQQSDMKKSLEKPNLWRHPRSSNVMPKGRNFH